MSTAHGRYDHDESQSTRSFNEYDTNEVRQRWRLSTPPRAKNVNRRESREVIDQQSAECSYVGRTHENSTLQQSESSSKSERSYQGTEHAQNYRSGSYTSGRSPHPIRLPNSKKASSVCKWPKSDGSSVKDVYRKFIDLFSSWWALLFVLLLLLSLGLYGYQTRQKYGQNLTMKNQDNVTFRQWTAKTYNSLPNPINLVIQTGSGIAHFFGFSRDSNQDSTESSTAVGHTFPSDIKSLENIIENAVMQKSEALMVNLEKFIDSRISKHSADKTGQPDYALESTGASVAGTGYTRRYKGPSLSLPFLDIPIYDKTFKPKIVIQRRTTDLVPGECWSFMGGQGVLFIRLSHKINVTSVSYEHLLPHLTPKGHTGTAPKDFQLWSIQNYQQQGIERKHLLGTYTFADTDEALQVFVPTYPDKQLTEVIGFEILTNYGSPATCLYRFRVHGQPEDDMY